MLISCLKLCSTALILKTECVVISQWLCVCVFGTKGPARRVSGIPHFFTIGCVVFRILSGVRLKIIIFTSSGGAPHGSLPFQHLHTHTTNSQLYSTAKIPFLVRPNSAPKLAVQQFYVGKKKNYAEKLVIID